jgi:alternate signal-mediated exported protein
MNRTRKRSRKAAVIVSVALSAVIALSATFAWITSAISKINHFENSGYIVDEDTAVINEKFNPPTEWTPGVEVEKNVSVTNTGAGPILVRVSFEELLKTLGNGGAVTTLDSDADSSATTGLIPALVNASAYDVSNWDVLNIELNLTVPDVSYEATLTDFIIKKSKTGDALVAYKNLGSGEYQSAKVNGHAVSDEGSTGSINTITLTEKLSLNWFTEGAEQYDSWNNKHGITVWDGKTDATTDTFPAFTNIIKSQLNSKIALNYNVALSETLTDFETNEGDWYYNAADGYFYYIGALNGGQSTPLLLESVLLADNAPEFLKVSYDLGVKLESIQAVKEAVSDNSNGGWNISETALLTALQAACAE